MWCENEREITDEQHNHPTKDESSTIFSEGYVNIIIVSSASFNCKKKERNNLLVPILVRYMHISIRTSVMQARACCSFYKATRLLHYNFCDWFVVLINRENIHHYEYI